MQPGLTVKVLAREPKRIAPLPLSQVILGSFPYYSTIALEQLLRGTEVVVLVEGD